MGCGCGGSKKTNYVQPKTVVTKVQTIKAIPPSTINNVNVASRCKVCSWPTRKFNHYDQNLKKFLNVYICTNAQCNRRTTS